jgi:hypothetical protein
MPATVWSPDSLSWNFRQPEVPTQTAESSDSYVDFTTSAKMNFEYEISYDPTSKWLGRHVESLPWRRNASTL